jgi:AraC-like DNA-binding protein
VNQKPEPPLAGKDWNPMDLQQAIRNLILVRLHLAEIPIDTCQGTLQVFSAARCQIQCQSARLFRLIFGICSEYWIQHLRLNHAGQKRKGSDSRILWTMKWLAGSSLPIQDSRNSPASTDSIYRCEASLDIEYAELPGTIFPARPELTLITVPTGFFGSGCDLIQETTGLCTPKTFASWHTRQHDPRHFG